MPRRLLDRYLPAPGDLAAHPVLGLLGDRLADPALWQLHRRSAAGAVFWGLWCAMLPMPLQMLPAAGLAILFRVNLPLTLLLVWVNNPLTIVPLMWLAYWMGSQLLGLPMAGSAELLQFLGDATAALGHWLGIGKAVTADLSRHLRPFFLGAVALGFAAGCLGYALTRLAWRLRVQYAWRRRRQRRLSRPA